MSRLLPCPGYYKYCFSEYWSACVFFNYGLLSLCAQEWGLLSPNVPNPLARKAGLEFTDIVSVGMPPNVLGNKDSKAV